MGKWDWDGKKIAARAGHIVKLCFYFEVLVCFRQPQLFTILLSLIITSYPYVLLINYDFSPPEIGDQEFFFIAGNYFCKDNNQEYVPAEIALTKYSLNSGCINKYHAYLDPGK